MALNKHMQAAVDEINGDIAQLQQEIEQLKMVSDCIDRLYGGEEPKPKKSERSVLVTLMVPHAAKAVKAKEKTKFPGT